MAGPPGRHFLVSWDAFRHREADLQCERYRINTSALCHGEKAPMPSRDILTLYRDLGGTILTFGSGCIRQGQLGAYLKVAEDMARSLGFSSFCTFENLEPHHHIL